MVRACASVPAAGRGRGGPACLEQAFGGPPKMGRPGSRDGFAGDLAQPPRAAGHGRWAAYDGGGLGGTPSNATAPAASTTTTPTSSTSTPTSTTPTMSSTLRGLPRTTSRRRSGPPERDRLRGAVGGGSDSALYTISKTKAGEATRTVSRPRVARPDLILASRCALGGPAGRENLRTVSRPRVEPTGWVRVDDGRPDGNNGDPVSDANLPGLGSQNASGAHGDILDCVTMPPFARHMTVNLSRKDLDVHECKVMDEFAFHDAATTAGRTNDYDHDPRDHDQHDKTHTPYSTTGTAKIASRSSFVFPVKQDKTLACELICRAGGGPQIEGIPYNLAVTSGLPNMDFGENSLMKCHPGQSPDDTTCVEKPFLPFMKAVKRAQKCTTARRHPQGRGRSAPLEAIPEEVVAMGPGDIQGRDSAYDLAAACAHAPTPCHVELGIASGTPARRLAYHCAGLADLALVPIEELAIELLRLAAAAPTTTSTGPTTTTFDISGSDDDDDGDNNDDEGRSDDDTLERHAASAPMPRSTVMHIVGNFGGSNSSDDGDEDGDDDEEVRNEGCAPPHSTHPAGSIHEHTTHDTRGIHTNHDMPCNAHHCQSPASKHSGMTTSKAMHPDSAYDLPHGRPAAYASAGINNSAYSPCAKTARGLDEHLTHHTTSTSSSSSRPAPPCVRTSHVVVSSMGYDDDGNDEDDDKTHDDSKECGRSMNSASRVTPSPSPRTSSPAAASTPMATATGLRRDFGDDEYHVFVNRYLTPRIDLALAPLAALDASIDKLGDSHVFVDSHLAPRIDLPRTPSTALDAAVISSSALGPLPAMPLIDSCGEVISNMGSEHKIDLYINTSHDSARDGHRDSPCEVGQPTAQGAEPVALMRARVVRWESACEVGQPTAQVAEPTAFVHASGTMNKEPFQSPALDHNVESPSTAGRRDATVFAELRLDDDHPLIFLEADGDKDLMLNIAPSFPTFDQHIGMNHANGLLDIGIDDEHGIRDGYGDQVSDHAEAEFKEQFMAGAARTTTTTTDLTPPTELTPHLTHDDNIQHDNNSGNNIGYADVGIPSMTPHHGNTLFFTPRGTPHLPQQCGHHTVFIDTPTVHGSPSTHERDGRHATELTRSHEYVNEHTRMPHDVIGIPERAPRALPLESVGTPAAVLTISTPTDGITTCDYEHNIAESRVNEDSRQQPLDFSTDHTSPTDLSDSCGQSGKTVGNDNADNMNEHDDNEVDEKDCHATHLLTEDPFENKILESYRKLVGSGRLASPLRASSCSSSSWSSSSYVSASARGRVLHSSVSRSMLDSSPSALSMNSAEIDGAHVRPLAPAGPPVTRMPLRGIPWADLYGDEDLEFWAAPNGIESSHDAPPYAMAGLAVDSRQGADGPSRLSSSLSSSSSPPTLTSSSSSTVGSAHSTVTSSTSTHSSSSTASSPPTLPTARPSCASAGTDADIELYAELAVIDDAMDLLCPTFREALERRTGATLNGNGVYQQWIRDKLEFNFADPIHELWTEATMGAHESINHAAEHYLHGGNIKIKDKLPQPCTDHIVGIIGCNGDCGYVHGSRRFFAEVPRAGGARALRRRTRAGGARPRFNRLWCRDYAEGHCDDEVGCPHPHLDERDILEVSAFVLARRGGHSYIDTTRAEELSL